MRISGLKVARFVSVVAVTQLLCINRLEHFHDDHHGRLDPHKLPCCQSRSLSGQTSPHSILYPLSLSLFALSSLLLALAPE